MDLKKSVIHLLTVVDVMMTKNQSIILFILLLI